MNKVGIVMAVYNGEAYIEEQIRSILQGSYGDLHLYLFDDGSTDDTDYCVRRCQNSFPGRITFCRNEKNKGVIGNFLEGAASLSEEYIMFADQDDVWFPNKVKESLHAMKLMEQEYGKSTPLLICSDATVTNSELEVVAESFHKNSHLNLKKMDLSHLLMENKVLGCTMMLNRCLANRLDRLPENCRMHDWWLALVAASLGQVGYMHWPTLYYRQHGNNLVGNPSYEEYVKKRKGEKEKIKDSLRANYAQAGELLRLFGTQMKQNEKKIVAEFAQLGEKNFLVRRGKVFLGHYTKSGFLRNLGLMLFL